MDWSKLPKNVDFLAFVNWMSYRGTWSSCTILFFDTSSHERYIWRANPLVLKHLTPQDNKRNQELPKCPSTLLKEAYDHPPDKVLRSESGCNMEELFESLVKRCGKQGTCRVATINLADYQYLDEHLPEHEVIHFGKDVGKEEVMAEFGRRWKKRDVNRRGE